MKICPQCQTEYDDTRKFCRHDGSPLETKTANERTAHAGGLACPQCGKPVEAGKRFCRHCGAPVTPKTTSKIELLEKQLTEEPGQVSVMVDLAEGYLEAGRVRRAVELLEKAVVQRGEDSHTHILLGKAREAAGDYDRALDSYMAAVESNAWSPEVEAALFREDFLLKTYPRSVDELSRVAAQRGSGQLWRLLAQVSEAEGNHDKAVTFLTEAVRVKPDDEASLEALARISERRQEMEEAKRWHQHILEVNPGSRSSNLFFAQRHYASGEYEEATPYFERLLAGERGNRVYQLYWLLANVKGYGIHGYENGITEVLQWRDLTEAEKPLARELFVLAGEESLTKEDLTGAEQYLLRAHYLSPSREVAGTLAAVQERKGDQAQREGDFRQALISYQRAAEYDPGNQTYARKVARVVSLRTEENRRKREAVQRKIAAGTGLGLVALLLIVGGVFGYRKAREWFQTPSPQQEELASAVDKELASLPQGEQSSSPSTETAGNSEATGELKEKAAVSSFVAEPAEGRPRGGAEERPQIPTEEPERIAKATEPPKEEPRRSKVVTAKELEIHVSGKGKGDPNRSPEAIQQEVETHLSDLQEVYEKERAYDPSLMGSLVLDLTIEPDGKTSHARFQSVKIASKKLQDIIHGLAHEWRFSRASGAVQVSYPLFFLPPGMDAASIIAWEKSTAALEAGQKRTEVTPAPPEEEGIHDHRQAARPTPKRQVPLGSYQVITPTPLRGEPHADAFVVTQLRPGMKVRVVGVVGDYLEVRSRKGRPPGYVHQKDVMFVSSQ